MLHCICMQIELTRHRVCQFNGQKYEGAICQCCFKSGNVRTVQSNESGLTQKHPKRVSLKNVLLCNSVLKLTFTR
jgi:hypothetical protein